jgi:hypothetical protein
MHALRRVAVTALIGILLGACSSGVDWENYAPEVKARIDRMAVEGDCGGLQAEFDAADENDTAQRNRAGSGNADLMGYIDAKLSAAGCYG